MINPLSRYTMLFKRWAWVVVLGVVLCGGTSYIFSKLLHPVYQASTTLILNLCTPTSSAFDCTSAAVQALPTYTQLITSRAVLDPVITKHPGLTLTQLLSMTTIKPASGTQLIDIVVDDRNPQLAMQLANEIGQSMAQLANTQLPGTIQILPATLPTAPVSPNPKQNALIGALVGLGLALALIAIFEWIDDRIAGPEEIRELLGVDALAIIPALSRKELEESAENIPALAEGCRVLCANLTIAQANRPLKLVMVTSALASEGKSMNAMNLASFLALAGKRILLVDADFRHHGLSSYFQTDDYDGFAKVLSGMSSSLQPMNGMPTNVPGLHILSSGEMFSNPADVLQSGEARQIFEHFRKTSQFDYVILDAPPLLPVADAQILASYVDASILVIDVSKTPRKVLTRAKHALEKTRSVLLGTVLNKSRWKISSETRSYLNNARARSYKPDVMPPPHTPPLPDGVIVNQETVTVTVKPARKKIDD